MKKTKTFAKTFAQTKISLKTDAGNGNTVKHPKSKGQKKLRS
jgi:hypothetical protein